MIKCRGNVFFLVYLDKVRPQFIENLFKKTLYSGQFTLKTQLITPNYQVISPTHLVPQLFQRLTSFISVGPKS